MIQQTFTTFPNMKELTLQGCNLQSINIPESVQLERFIFPRNNISRITNETFSGQRRLNYISAVQSGIKVIEDESFSGLEALTHIILIKNEIEEVTPRTFALVETLFYLDLDGNRLTRLDDVFSSNPNLARLQLENNQINEISPRFTSNLRHSLTYVNFSNNRCISRSFSIDEELDLIRLHNSLRSCFNNYNGEVPETRRVTLEFQGPLALFDEFGNIIARVN